MRRAVIVCAGASLATVVALLVTGCGGSDGGIPVPLLVKAPPQHAELDWLERYPSQAPVLVFGVRSLSVTATGWTAAVSVENRSGVGWKAGDAQLAAERSFGLMLFPTGDLKELDRRNRAHDLPAIRAATSIEPALPDVLGAHATWRGTLSAPGALAAGLYARVSFGPFVSVGTPPPGVDGAVIWITDHAYRLSRTSATDA